jgi:hypothetical protein
MLGEIILAVEPIARRTHTYYRRCAARDGDYYGDSEYMAAGLRVRRREKARPDWREKEHIKGLNQLNGTEFLPLVPRARICSRAGLNSPL